MFLLFLPVLFSSIFHPTLFYSSFYLLFYVLFFFPAVYSLYFLIFLILLFSFQICYPFFSLSYYSVLSASPLCSIPIKSVLFLLVFILWYRAMMEGPETSCSLHKCVRPAKGSERGNVTTIRPEADLEGEGCFLFFAVTCKQVTKKWKRSNNIVQVHKN